MIQKGYYPTINLLRFLAAFFVCVYHFLFFQVDNEYYFFDKSILKNVEDLGVWAVFIFFMISGFVIPLSLKKINFQFSNFFPYFIKRWIRIEIPYLVSVFLLILIAFVFSIKNNISFDFDIKKIIHHLFYTIEFTNYSWYNPIFWTLAIEFQFYIIVALFFSILNSKNRIISYIVPISFSILSLFLTTKSLFFEYGAVFSIGISYYLYSLSESKIEKNLGVISLIGAFSVFAIKYDFAFLIVEIVAFLVLFFFEINHKIVNKLGSWTYSLYLTHGISGGSFLYLFARYFHTPVTKLILFSLAIVFSFLFTWIFWKYVENPSIKLSKKWNR